MRNILLLGLGVGFVLFWLTGLIEIEAESKSRSQDVENLVDFSDVNQKQFDPHALAKLLGVNYESIVFNKTEVNSSEYEVNASLISVYISGEQKRVRIKANKNDETQFFNLSVGEKFYGISLLDIQPTQVTLFNNQEQYFLKMYKPMSINVTETTNAVEETTKDEQ